MNNFTVKLLKKMCQQLEIPTTGLKEDLIKRVCKEIKVEVCRNPEPEPEPEPEPDPSCCRCPPCPANVSPVLNKISEIEIEKEQGWWPKMKSYILQASPWVIITITIGCFLLKIFHSEKIIVNIIKK